mgnify:CR=1 FL=1
MRDMQVIMVLVVVQVVVLVLMVHHSENQQLMDRSGIEAHLGVGIGMQLLQLTLIG